MEQKSEDEDDKQFDASERRLTQAREQGDFPKSDDLQAVVALAGLVLTIGLMGGWVAIAFGEVGTKFLAQPESFVSAQGKVDPIRVDAALAEMTGPLALLLAGPAAAAALYIAATRSYAFAPNRLAWNLSRLSVLANARQKFGRAGLVEFLLRAAKLGAVVLMAFFSFRDALPEIIFSSHLPPGAIMPLLLDSSIRFLGRLIVLLAALGMLDFFWHRLEFARRQRMTRQEMLDENKESEGDPHFKADRRRRAQEIATNRMMADVPKADVIIVNPTHYAVALQWNRKKGGAPRCVAKGVDEVAARIRAAAQAAGVPIHPDPPTARALHASVDIGREIGVEHYVAVAAAIRFADAMRKRAGRK